MIPGFWSIVHVKMNFNSSFYFTHKSFGHFNPKKWCNTEQEYTFLEQYKILRKGFGLTELPQIRENNTPTAPFFSWYQSSKKHENETAV